MRGEEEEGSYEAPPISALLDVLLKKRRDTGAVNLVWPRLYLSNASCARDKALLQDLGVTHVVNAAHGRRRIDTGPGYYGDAGVAYLGVEADDRKDFDIGAFFRETAEFVHSALTQHGVVLVHCARGVSRSAALVLAFLMIKRGLSLMEAVETVRTHRNILPNLGFLHQLRELDTALHRCGAEESRGQRQVNQHSPIRH
ncbi:dual specificity protein phosphatase 13B-like [Eucyclogobius newberryi]|uniref:dual specificity protein phosphatase 13B-like n=1 Tax=Eucyclogobius newberryi TaxID=166745 RepID=UPI003B5CADBF